MEAYVQAEVNHLLTKAGNLRHAAIATSMLQYRAMLLRVARELEAKAAALEVVAERRAH
jgi:hypothetical protein